MSTIRLLALSALAAFITACAYITVAQSQGSATPNRQELVTTTLTITDAADIRLARALAATIDAMPSPMAACVKAGKKPEACLCEQKDGLLAIDKALADVRARHPAWFAENTVVSWQQGSNSNMVAVPVLVAQRADARRMCGF